MKMKAYKNGEKAKLAANGRPVIRIGDLYLVGCDEKGSVEICLIGNSGLICGAVTAYHLDRLGNANWAIPDPKHKLGDRLFERK